jgi:hypothetical protein
MFAPIQDLGLAGNEGAGVQDYLTNCREEKPLPVVRVMRIVPSDGRAVADDAASLRSFNRDPKDTVEKVRAGHSSPDANQCIAGV